MPLKLLHTNGLVIGIGFKEDETLGNRTILSLERIADLLEMGLKFCHGVNFYEQKEGVEVELAEERGRRAEKLRKEHHRGDETLRQEDVCTSDIDGLVCQVELLGLVQVRNVTSFSYIQ